MAENAVTAESELRQVKATLATINELAAQADRGAPIDFSVAHNLIAEATVRVRSLVQGTLPTSNSGVGGSGGEGVGIGNGGVVLQSSGPRSLHARTGVSLQGNGAVTELQRRRAEQVLSELQLLDTTLQRNEKKQKQRTAYGSSVHQLVGNSAAAARNDYTAMDQLDREKQSLQYARRRMQTMEAESREVLKALQSQGTRLSGVGTKLGDMLESLGVSNTTILQIVRRNEVDAWIVYGGIALLLFFMWYLI